MYRIGHSWDTHKLVEGRKLILGGVQIENKLGLLGHSDADVVLHVIAESILGALALGDLGTFFPDNSDKTKDMDSKIIVKECLKKMEDLSYEIENIDVTIYAEYVKISPIREKIRLSISQILEIDLNKISLKATTYEKMGFIGRGEAIASDAVILLKAKN